MTTANIDAKLVMALRNATGLGVGDCRTALIESGADLAKAEALLRERLKGKMDNRSDRAAGEGCVSVVIDGAKAAIVQVRSETDFTAKNDEFRQLAKELATMALTAPAGEVVMSTEMTARLDTLRIKTGENISLARGVRLDGGSFASYVHHDAKIAVILQFEGALESEIATGICQHIVAAVPTPLAVDEHGLPADVVAAKRAEAVKEAAASGKPPQIAEKMAEGKVRKFFEDSTLLGQKFVKDDKKSVREILPKGVIVKSFVRMRVGT